ncbi:MAG: hypothetical protein AAAB13_20575 [Pseudomonas sp.]
MKADTKKQAEELGIAIDKNWTEAELQQQIDNVLAAPNQIQDPATGAAGGEEIIPPSAPPSTANKPVKSIGIDKKEKTTPVRILYDTWMEADVRTPAGEVVDLPISKAKELIEQGKAVRADKFPGE